MRCRVVVCAACCTRIDGVNHCHACLKVLGLREERAPAAVGSAALAGVLFLGLAWGLFFAIAWVVQGKLAP